MINTNCRNRIEDVFVKLEHYFKVSSLWAYHRFPIYGLPDHEIEPRIENRNPSHQVLDKKYERFIGNIQILSPSRNSGQIGSKMHSYFWYLKSHWPLSFVIEFWPNYLAHLSLVRVFTLFSHQVIPSWPRNYCRIASVIHYINLCKYTRINHLLCLWHRNVMKLMSHELGWLQISLL